MSFKAMKMPPPLLLVLVGGTALISCNGDMSSSSPLSMADASLLYTKKTGDTMSGALNLPTDGLIVGTSQLVTYGLFVGIGTTSPATLLDVSGATSAGIRSLGTQALGPNSGGGSIMASAFTPTAADQRLGAAAFGALYSGSTYKYQAGISAWSSEAWSTLPAYGTYLTFETTPNSTSTSRLERMRITSSGNVGVGTVSPSTKLQVAGEISPSADNSYSLGDASLRFTEVYAVNGAIQTSDARQKKDIQISDLGLDFINKLRPVSYHWNNGVDSDLHYGLIAQETEKALNEAKTQAGTQKESPEAAIVIHDPVSDRYGLKYAEFIAPVVKAIQELYNRLLGIERHLTLQDRDLTSLKADAAAKMQEVKSLKAENAQLKAELQAKDEARAKENAAIRTYLCAKDPNAPICH